MKIAQVAPLYERVPPKLYGGTERVVSYLTEELVRKGHDVTLFASGDSVTSARLVPGSDTSLRLNPAVEDALPYHLLMLERVLEKAASFDILHFHTDLLHLPVTRGFRHKSVTTLHGRLDKRDLLPFYQAFPDAPLVSISNDQREPMSLVNWAATIYHGLPEDLLSFDPAATGQYLAFLGRISPEKGPDIAIRIATELGMPLKIAAKVDVTDKAYWDAEIGPMIAAHPNVEFIGEVTERQKSRFLGGASALLFPVTWPEPFGLVMIEAMACGTPVIGYGAGAVPEVIDEGVTGFVVGNIAEAVAAVPKAARLDRAKIRQVFERRFTASRMADDYLRVYREILGTELATSRSATTAQARPHAAML